MLYQLHEFNRTLLNPLVTWSESGVRMFSSKDSWLSHLPGAHRMAANYELLYRLGKDYEKPAFDIRAVHAHGTEVPIVEQVALEKPFCRLLRFKRYSDEIATFNKLKQDPVVLVVAPLSGHHATLLRDTVRTLLQDHKVYITDWIDARMVPVDKRPVSPRRLRRLHPGIHPPHRRRAPARDLGLPADRAGAGGDLADGRGRRNHAAHHDDDGRPDRHAQKPDQGQRSRHHAVDCRGSRPT